MARRVRTHDWASTPIGPIEAWPQSLRTTVALVIASPVPIVLLWGEHGVMIYNDAYSVFAGGRHPQLLGSNVLEGWPEVADFNANVMKVGMAGGTLAYKDQELTLHRSGRPEQVWMDLDYWPVPDESGRPGGVIATVVETTARIESDRARNATNPRLERALSAGRGVGTWDWNIGSDRVVADARFAEMYGVDPSLARAGAPLSEFFKAMHPGDAPRVAEEIQRSVQNRSPFRSEYRLVGNDDQIRWVAAEGRIVVEPDGTLRFPGVTFDITERRETDAALAETEIRYDALFGATSTGFCIVQMKFDEYLKPVDYMIVEGNPAFEQMTGLHGVNGKWVSEIAPGLEQHWFDLYGRVALTGETARFENPADIFGRWYAVEALRIGDPAAHRVAILFTNITDRKQQESRQGALIELNDTLRDLTDPDEIAAASSAILARALNVTRAGYGVMDVEAETVDIARDYNAPGMTSIAGRLKFRDFGSYIEDLARGETVVVTDTRTDPRTQETAEALAGIGVASFINMPLKEQGAVVAIVFVNNVAPRTWSDSDIELLSEVAARVRIAIERARTQEALQALNATLEERVLERTDELSRAHEALRQSQKMEAVGQLTGGIAHDFNNLLAGISGSLELLSKRLSEGRLNGMERYIDAAQGSAQRAASLTQRLLAFSRRQTLDPKPTDVNRLINGMEDLVRRSVGPDIEVEVVGAGGLWATRIDQSQLENALLNLCINARDAMAPDGGRLTIETSNKWLDDRAAKARDLPSGQYVSLCVTDTGTGMPPEVQAQAFDPFFTTKPLGQGTGLGLSMIHGFVRQSGGQVRIYSEIGKGTTMCLYLPRYQGDVDGDEDIGVIAVAEGGHGETVLIIDDEQTVRMLVAEVLGDAGYNVIEAPDGPSGLEILRSERRIDLLISDVGLPGGMNGRQVADAARVSRPDLKVLFITGYAENAAVGNGLLAPGMEVLTKPFVMGDLAAKVHDMIEG